MCGEIGGDAEEQAAEFIADQRDQAGRRLHRRLHGAAGQDDGPRRRDRLRLAGHRHGEGRGARGKGVRVGRTPDRGRRARGLTARRLAPAGRSRPRRVPLGTWPSSISFARGAPSLDIVDVEGLGGRGRPAFDDRSRRHDRLRDRDRLPAAARVDRRAPRRRARAGDRHQRLDAGRRVPVRRAGRARRLGGRRAPDLRPHAAVAAQPRRRRADGRARARRDRRRRRRARARGGRQAEARPHHPQLPEPGRLHAVGRQARPAAGARRASYDFTVFEDDPYVALRFEGAPLPTMLSLDGDRVVYASSFSKTVCPGIRVGYLVGPDGADRPDRQARDQHVHLAEHGRPVDRQRVLPLGRDRALDRDRQGGAARARRRRCARRCARELPDARFVEPEGGYFLWVDLPRGHRRRRAVRAAAERGVRSSRAPTSCSRAARRASASPTPASRPSRSRRASTGSPTPTARRRPASPPERPAGH